MKKLMIAMCLAGALCAFSADEAAPKAEGKAPARRQMGQRPPRQPLTEAQRQEFREKFLAQMKTRREETQKKIVNTLKEAGLEEAKAKETAEKIEKIMMEGRRMGPGMGPGMGGRGPGMGRGPRGERQGRRGPRAEKPAETK